MLLIFKIYPLSIKTIISGYVILFTCIGLFFHSEEINHMQLQEENPQLRKTTKKQTKYLEHKRSAAVIPD